jgi:hypothetical protein
MAIVGIKKKKMFVSIFRGGLSTGFAGVLFDAYISKHTGTLTYRINFSIIIKNYNCFNWIKCQRVISVRIGTALKFNFEYV